MASLRAASVWIQTVLFKHQSGGNCLKCRAEHLRDDDGLAGGLFNSELEITAVICGQSQLSEDFEEKK